MIELSPVSQSRLRGEMRVVSYEIDACCGCKLYTHRACSSLALILAISRWWNSTGMSFSIKKHSAVSA